MRVAVIADSHFDQSSRWDECCRVHEWIAVWCRENAVDIVCLSGDLFERKSTPHERTHVAGWLRRLAEHHTVIGVYGNHEAVEDLDVFNLLATRYPVRFHARPAVVLGASNRGAGLTVMCLPWPRKAHLAAALGAVSLEAAGLAAGEALRSVLRGLGQQADAHPGPRLLLTHAMVRGSMTSAGQPLVGCDLEVSLEDLDLARADAVALGHVHRQQAWVLDSGAPAIYPGSPRRTSFGEVEPKGFVVLDFDEHHSVSWERVETPCAPMLLVSATWEPGALRWAGVVGPLEGAEIRLRYSVANDQRDAARDAAGLLRAEWIAAGACVVKVEEEVITTQRARAPEIAAALTIEDKLRALWARQGIEGERVERLLGRVGHLNS